MQDLGRLLVLSGGCLVAIGLLFVFGDRIPWFGRLPGDILIRRDGLTIIFPLATMLLVSVVLTVVANLVAHIFRE